MPALLLAFAVSCLLAVLLVRGLGGRMGAAQDHDLDGPQKFHARPVPRIGGVAVMGGLLAATGLLALRDPVLGLGVAMLLGCALPTFAAGLVEDLTKRVSPGRRLLAAAVSAAMGVALLNAVIQRTDIPGLDWVVSFAPLAACVTVFAVTGVANAFNIIDGFNGLASMCSVLILAAIGYVAFQVGDRWIVYSAVVTIGAVLGFFVWNYPRGLIFLGDGGAYLLGFITAELAVLLMQRNAQVSPLFPLLACIYPVFETVFSIYRRVLLRERPAGMPDGIHLHSLIYRRLVRWAAGDRSARALTRRNSMTSPFLWVLCASSLVPAVLFWDSSAWLGGSILVFALVYTSFYRRIVRFRVPRWLIVRRRFRVSRMADNSQQ